MELSNQSVLDEFTRAVSRLSRGSLESDPLESFTSAHTAPNSAQSLNRGFPEKTKQDRNAQNVRTSIKLNKISFLTIDVFVTQSLVSQ